MCKHGSEKFAIVKVTGKCEKGFNLELDKHLFWETRDLCIRRLVMVASLGTQSFVLYKKIVFVLRARS
jgi:hypothetical protein